MKHNGFTMIEVLIVIVIIGILATLGGSTYAKSIQKGRDAQQVEDLKAIQKGFETYYSLGSTYVNPTQDMFDEPTIFPAGEIMNKSTGSSYTYSNPSTSTYCVCALMRATDSSGGLLFANSANNSCDFTGSPKTHFCVANVQ